MSDRPTPPPAGDDDAELGTPIAELAALRVTPASGFLGRIRGRIERRVLAADTVELATSGPLRVFIEFLNMLFEGFRGRPRGEDRRDGE